MKIRKLSQCLCAVIVLSLPGLAYGQTTSDLLHKAIELKQEIRAFCLKNGKRYDVRQTSYVDGQWSFSSSSLLASSSGSGEIHGEGDTLMSDSEVFDVWVYYPQQYKEFEKAGEAEFNKEISGVEKAYPQLARGIIVAWKKCKAKVDSYLNVLVEPPGLADPSQIGALYQFVDELRNTMATLERRLPEINSPGELAAYHDLKAWRANSFIIIDRYYLYNYDSSASVNVSVGATPWSHDFQPRYNYCAANMECNCGGDDPVQMWPAAQDKIDIE